MRRAAFGVFVAGCLAAMVLGCFGPVLFHDRQFSYRDAGEFYYPLYQRVQQEWAAGRWPLWEPGENGGTPLLANPSAAVLYPAKLVFALPISYAWGARLYVIVHVLLAFGTMVVLLRGWRVSPAGSALGGLAYGFGAPVLFQYCNVIFLVGAAWVPLGFCLVDRVVRLASRGAIPALGAVLAMQVLGGDPESAYLVLASGVLYSGVLVWSEGGGPRLRPWLIVAFAGAWVGLTLGSAFLIAKAGAWFPFPADGAYPGWFQGLVLAGWGVVVWRMRRQAGLRGLALSAALAVGLSGAQVLPTAELVASSTRSGGHGRHEIFGFSVEPVRALELLWPGCFGSYAPLGRYWLPLIPPLHLPKPWVASLYLGALTLLLAARGAGWKKGPPWHAWLSAVAIVSLLGALGEFGSPVWWAREVPGLASILGGHDPSALDPARIDGGVSDGAGSAYWLMATALPGLQSFRYPGKLLTFAALALAALAGLGWDRLREGRPARLAAILLGISLAILLAVSAARGMVVRWFDAAGKSSARTGVGPFDAKGAVNDLWWSLAHASVVVGLAAIVVSAARRGNRWAAPAALALLSADLTVANAPLIMTAPQALFDEKPRVARLIEEAEARDPSPGPFRVHRMTFWHPLTWSQSNSNDRLLEIASWERDTLKPKYGLPEFTYTKIGSTFDRYDYSLFFLGFLVPLDPERLTLRGAYEGGPVMYFTRRGFDLWNTRYFILPMEPGDWRDGSRGIVSFLTDEEMIAPDPALLDDPNRGGDLEAWIRNADWQLLRNKAAYPRAWVVHRARFLKPIGDITGPEGNRLMRQMLFANDAVWHNPSIRVEDPHTLAWVETDDPKPLASFAPGGNPGAEESVRITRYEPQRVEIEARLDRPGIVILADVNYPGWSLTIDGQSSPILRTNRLMRGAAVPAGTHRLVYTYRPLSFYIGGVVSLVSLVVAMALSVRWRSYSMLTGSTSIASSTPLGTGTVGGTA